MVYLCSMQMLNRAQRKFKFKGKSKTMDMRLIFVDVATSALLSWWLLRGGEVDSSLLLCSPYVAQYIGYSIISRFDFNMFG